MRRIHQLALSMLTLTAVACGDGGNNVAQPVPQPPAPEPITEAPEINPPTGFSGALVQPGEEAVALFLKNGIYAASFNQFRTLDDPTAPAQEAANAVASNNFSTTNTQELGVDEADRIEYDGNFMYVATYPIWLESGELEPAVRILQRNDDFSLTEVNSLPIEPENTNVQGIYLADNRLAVVGSDFQYYSLNTTFIEPWLPQQQKVSVSIYDTEDPVNATNLATMQLDGWLISSRRIENNLYLVSSYVASVESLELGTNDEDTLLQNYLTILDTPTADLMPKLYVNDTSQRLNDAEDCYIPERAAENDGHAQLVTVTRINLSDPADITSSCMSLLAETLYMSQQNMYLASSFDSATSLHKIGLDENLSYQASGDVRGILGWQNPNLRLSEHQGYLRLVTSDYMNFDEPEHFLSVLQQTGNRLEVVASLPNEQQPEPIGKPNEDVYAVRFFGDKGYVVTFERIDPLYVLDLSDPTNPMLAGSLEIPGFSSYLQPIGEEYVLGVGQEVQFIGTPENGEPIDAEWNVPPITTTGAKVSLFDVRDPVNPIEVGTIVKEDAYTPVEYDYRALSVLNEDSIYKFAMPIERWGQATGDVAISYYMPINSLLMMEVDTANASLTEVGEVITDSEAAVYVFAGEDRSILHGEYVFYLHGNLVWQTLWNTDAVANGPY